MRLMLKHFGAHWEHMGCDAIFGKQSRRCKFGYKGSNGARFVAYVLLNLRVDNDCGRQFARSACRKETYSYLETNDSFSRRIEIIRIALFEFQTSQHRCVFVAGLREAL